MGTSSLGRRILAGLFGPASSAPGIPGPPPVDGYPVPRRVLAGVLGVDLPRRETVPPGGGPDLPGPQAAAATSQEPESGADGPEPGRPEGAGERDGGVVAGESPTPATVTIRSVRDSELQAVHRVDRLVFGRLAYPYFVLRQLVELHWNYCAVAEDRGELIGYCFGARSEGRQVGWVLGLAVLPNRRGAGYARDLVREVTFRLFADGMQEIQLAVYPDNDRAIELYESLGFHAVAVRPDYFGPGADRLIMSVGVGEVPDGEWEGSDEIGEWLASDAQEAGIGLGMIYLRG